MAERFGPEDFVVGGWDDLSVLYSDLWAYPGRYMDLFMEAGSYGPGATTHLRAAALQTKENGGRFYFIGVLDVSGMFGIPILVRDVVSPLLTLMLTGRILARRKI